MEEVTKYLKQALIALGIDLSDPNYSDTPRRMAEVMTEFTEFARDGGKEIDEHLNKIFPKHNGQKSEYKGMLVQSPIRVYSLCSHHFLPIIYDISFAYIPKDNKQIGFSKIIRVMDLVAKKPMNQEDFTQTLVDIFYEKLEPKGLALVVSGTHMCMKMRGVRADTINRTSAVKGDFKDYERTRDEFLTLANFKDGKV